MLEEVIKTTREAGGTILAAVNLAHVLPEMEKMRMRVTRMRRKLKLKVSSFLINLLPQLGLGFSAC